MTTEEYKKLNCKPTDPSTLQTKVVDGILQVAPDYELWSPYMFNGFEEEKAKEFTAWHMDANNFFNNPYVSKEDNEALWGIRKTSYEEKWGETIFPESAW